MTTNEAKGILAVIFGFGAVYEVAINGANARIMVIIALMAIMVLLMIVLGKVLRWYHQEEGLKNTSSKRLAPNSQSTSRLA